MPIQSFDLRDRLRLRETATDRAPRVPQKGSDPSSLPPTPSFDLLKTLVPEWPSQLDAWA